MHSPYQDAVLWRCISSRSHTILYAVMYFKDSFFHCKHFQGMSLRFKDCEPSQLQGCLAKSTKETEEKAGFCNLACFVVWFFFFFIINGKQTTKQNLPFTPPKKSPIETKDLRSANLHSQLSLKLSVRHFVLTHPAFVLFSPVFL